MIGSAALFVATLLAEAATPAPAPTAPDPQNKIICRRYLETGSLVKSTKVCHTRAEWARVYEAARRDSEEFTTAKNGVNSN